MDPKPAVAARLRSLFDQQSEALADYLRLVEAQERSLHAEDAARLEAQLEAEGALLDRLEALRRASDALEQIYREAHPAGDPGAEASRALAARRAGAVADRSGPRRQSLTAIKADVERRLRALRSNPARGSGPGRDTAGILDVSR